MIGNASLIELLWLGFGLVAYTYSIRNHRRARRNLRALLSSGRNGRYLLAAKHNLREETLRVVKSVAIIAAGLIASATPPTVTPQPLTVVGVTITIVLFVISAGITYGAIASSRYYDRFEQYSRLRQQERSRRGDPDDEHDDAPEAPSRTD